MRKFKRSKLVKALKKLLSNKDILVDNDMGGSAGMVTPGDAAVGPQVHAGGHVTYNTFHTVAPLAKRNKTKKKKK